MTPARGGKGVFGSAVVGNAIVGSVVENVVESGHVAVTNNNNDE